MQSISSYSSFQGWEMRGSHALAEKLYVARFLRSSTAARRSQREVDHLQNRSMGLGHQTHQELKSHNTITWKEGR